MIGAIKQDYVLIRSDANLSKRLVSLVCLEADFGLTRYEANLIASRLLQAQYMSYVLTSIIARILYFIIGAGTVVKVSERDRIAKTARTTLTVASQSILVSNRKAIKLKRRT